MTVAAQLGPMHAHSLEHDPRHVAFVLARYLFVAKMVTGCGNVLEVGCGDGTGAHIVRPVVQKLYGLDMVAPLNYPGGFLLADILRSPVPISGGWDAVFALDVLEHIHERDEDKMLHNMCWHLNSTGIAIIGMPSAESQPYASELSKRYHVNTKTEDQLRTTMRRHFSNVFMFGQNDCTLHTGFGPFCNYRLALCTQRRRA